MTNSVLRFSDDFADLVWVLTELDKRLPQLKTNPLYLVSIPQFLTSAAHKCIIAGPTETALEDATAFGVVRFFEAPMLERLVMAVEAMWFADDRLDAQVGVWRYMVSIAQKMDFYGICVNERSVNTPGTLKELLAQGGLDGNRVAETAPLLQTPVGGVYSAFTDGPLGTSAFVAPCITIFTLRAQVDLSGVPASFT